LPVQVNFEGRIVSGDLVNISLGGLSFEARADLAIDDELRFTLRVVPDKVCRGVGRVLRSSESSFGVEFRDINEPMREFVADLLRLRDELRTDFLRRVVNPMIDVDRANRA